MKHFISSLLLCAAILRAYSQGTAFTYQGRLDDSGQPAGGIYDLRFTIYAVSTGGSPIAALTNSTVGVSNGLFTVTLDFGAEVFTGAERWLEIGVRTYDSGAFTTLWPRQPLTSAPYAIRAANFSGPVDAGQLTGIISPGHIGAGSIDSTKLAAGAVTANILAAGAVTTASIAASAVTSGQIAKGAVTADKVATVLDSFVLTVTNPVPTELLFGLSVAAVGSDRFAVGGSGEAYLFNGNGRLLTAFTNPLSPGFGGFGISVAAVGNDRVLIGAQSQTIGGVGAGAAFLFNTNAMLLITFTNPTPASGDNFGSSVAAVGSDRVLIAALQDDTGATNAGAAYLFSTNGALLTTFTNPTPANGDFFGTSVAAVGSDRVLIGAQSDSTSGTGAGAAYLFDANGALLLTLTSPVPRPAAGFGRSVATVGNDRLLIGEPGGAGGGAVHLFRTNGALLATLTNPDPPGNDIFGVSVAAVGNDRILVGASQDDAGATNSGTAYLFSTNGALLATFNNPTPATDDSFGFAVTAVGNNRVLIGDYTDDTGAGNAGAAYLFTLESFTPGLVADTVRAGSITAISLDDTIGVWTRSGSDVFRSSGNVGIGTTTPGAPLQVAADLPFMAIQDTGPALEQTGYISFWNATPAETAWVGYGSVGSPHFSVVNVRPSGNIVLHTSFGPTLIATSSGRVGIGTDMPNAKLSVNGTANNATGAWGVFSDRRLKENIKPMAAGSLDRLLQLKGVTYDYNRPELREGYEGTRRGWIAQEVEQVFPEWVSETSDGMKMLTPVGFNALVVEALRELRYEKDAAVEKLKAENAELKARLEKLEQRVPQTHQAGER